MQMEPDVAIQDPRTVVKNTTRLWSTEVAIAEGSDDPPPQHDPAYEFSNGRKFVERAHYAGATEGYGDE